MRFVLAIVLFVVAFVSLGLGIAQRTLLQGPDHVTASATVSGGAPFTVIDGDTLGVNPGSQLVELSGAGTLPVFLAYGRSADVRAWLEGSEAVQLDYVAETGELVAGPLQPLEGEVEPSEPTPEPGDTATPDPSNTAAPVPSAESDDPAAESGGVTASDAASDVDTENADATDALDDAIRDDDPVGSDLWIQEFAGEGSLVRKINVPRDVSVLIATNGTAAAPSQVAVTWPLDNSTPWSGPLIVGGIGVLLLGLVALIWALVHVRRRHGPRRKSPKMPKMPKPPQLRPARRRAAAPATSSAARGRRRAFVVLPLVLMGSVALSACAPDRGTDVVPEPGTTDAVLAEVEPPVVTKQQFSRIVAQTADTVAAADAEGDAELAATRLSGPALALRTAHYTARAADSSLTGLPAFPDGEIRLILPQQQRDWPRAVFTAIESSDGAEYGAMFLQASPREQYKVEYLVRLTQSIPEVAPIDLGASRYRADSKLLAFPPSAIGFEYGDVLINGDTSEFVTHFDLSDDLLNEKLGSAYKEERRNSLAQAKLSYADVAGSGEPIALAANDTGAIVAVDIREAETVKPGEEGAAINPKGAVKALSERATTTKGIVAEYGLQILFYVPPVTAEDQKSRVLGFTDGLVAAREVA